MTSTWYLYQASDEGNVTISVDGSSDLIITEQFGGTANLGNAGASLQIMMLSGTGTDLDIDLDSALTGSLHINLGNGDRFGPSLPGNPPFTEGLEFIGSVNSIGGDLTIIAGTGIQSLNLASDPNGAITGGADLFVGGNAYIDLGLGFDYLMLTDDPGTFVVPRGASIGDNLTLRGVNVFEHTGFLFVGRDFSWTNNFETESNLYRAFDGTALFPPTIAGGGFIGGNFTYRGGSLDDALFFDDVGGAVPPVIVGGNFYADLGSNFEATVPFGQQIRLEGTTIGGNVTAIAGMNPFASDLFATDEFTVIGGNIYINFGDGIGDNPFNALPPVASEVILLGTFGGHSILFYGSTGNDSIGFGMVGNKANVSAILGLGEDTFTLNGADGLVLAPGTAELANLYVDFGPGLDTFDNFFLLPFTFQAILRGLP